MENKVDYVEGFMVLNEQSLQGSSVSFPSYMGFIQQRHATSSDVFYCLEFAVHCHLEKESSVDQVSHNSQPNLSLSHTQATHCLDLSALVGPLGLPLCPQMIMKGRRVMPNTIPYLWFFMFSKWTNIIIIAEPSIV